MGHRRPTESYNRVGPIGQRFRRNGVICSAPLKRHVDIQRGLTLIELLIVLTIIGLLASIAIPQFLAFRSKAMQSEVKANFSAFHRAQQTYYSENNAYTDDIQELAWRPVGQPRYLYGFTSDAYPAASGTNDTAELAAVEPDLDYVTVNMVTFGVPLTDVDLPPGVNVAVGGFTFGAAANLDDDAELDLWEITQANNFEHFQNDAR